MLMYIELIMSDAMGAAVSLGWVARSRFHHTVTGRLRRVPREAAWPDGGRVGRRAVGHMGRF